MLSESQIIAGVKRNEAALEASINNQLYIEYRRIIPTVNTVRYPFQSPVSAADYLLEYITISLPANDNLDNFFFVAYDDAGNLKYVSENLRSDRLGAKVSLFTTPGADKDPATAGDQKAYKGMIPIFVKLKGTEILTFDFRGSGLANLEYVDIMVYGHRKNRIAAGRGYYGNL